MPKCSRTHQARIANLPNRPKNTRTTLEDIPEDIPPPEQAEPGPWQPWEKPEFLDVIGALRGTAIVEDEDDEDLEGDLDTETQNCQDDEEIVELSALEVFTQTLQQVHNIVEAFECQKAKQCKRPKHYSGNSDQSKRRHQQKGREILKKGFPSVAAFFKPISEQPTEPSPSAIEVLQVSDSDSSESETDEESPIPLKRCWREAQTDGNAADLEPVQVATETTPCEVTAEVPSLGKGDAQAHSKQDQAAKVVEEMLRDLREGKTPQDNTEETATDRLLDQMSYQDFPCLRKAMAKLNVLIKDKKLDIFLRAQLTGMAATLNLYLDSQLSCTWRQASMIVAKSQGHGAYRARCIREWIHQFLHHDKLPIHCYSGTKSSILQDEDISLEIQIELAERSKAAYIKAQDVVEVVSGPRVQKMLADAGILKRSISEPTAREWLVEV